MKRSLEGVDMMLKHKKLSGYFTVEAAFLMPVFICVIALLCYLAFYMCNRAMLPQDAYILGLRGSLMQEAGNGEVSAYLSQQGKGMISKYYAVSKVGRMIQVNGREISVELAIEMQVPFAFLTWEDGRFMSRIWEIKEKKIVDRTNPVDFIRVCRKIEKALEK